MELFEIEAACSKLQLALQETIAERLEQLLQEECDHYRVRMIGDQFYPYCPMCGVKL